MRTAKLNISDIRDEAPVEASAPQAPPVESVREAAWSVVDVLPYKTTRRRLWDFVTSPAVVEAVVHVGIAVVCGYGIGWLVGRGLTDGVVSGVK